MTHVSRRVDLPDVTGVHPAVPTLRGEVVAILVASSRWGPLIAPRLVGEFHCRTGHRRAEPVPIFTAPVGLRVTSRISDIPTSFDGHPDRV